MALRLVTFSDRTSTRVGALDADGSRIFDLGRSVPDLATDMQGIIEAGEPALAAIRRAVSGGTADIAVADVTLHAPIPRPRRNILCVGKNYREHAEEFHNSGFDASAGASAVPEVPIIFTKWSSSVIGPGQPIPAHLDPTASVDYEGELAVVIGRAGRGIAQADAFDHVWGYTIINDVTSRTLQHRHKQWFIGKSIDGFCPMGPALVPAGDIADVGALELNTLVNGELRQKAALSLLIFNIPQLIEALSASMTLEPGDIIATGTCAGVGLSFEPPKFMKAGDVVEITIEPIGTLRNPVK